MKASTKRALRGMGIVAVLLAGLGGCYLRQVALVGAAYKAKVLCSGVFVSCRDPASLLKEDLLADDLSRLRYFDAEIDYERQSVTASLFGLIKRQAIFRPELGCTLVIGSSAERLRAQSLPARPALSTSCRDQPWPAGELAPPGSLPPQIDAAKLDAALEAAFAEPDPNRLRRTRAVVVVYKSRLIAERYAPGFSPDTPLPGWSMTKGVINALTGILVGEGKLFLEERALLPAWSKPGDLRGEITLDQLLRMKSGLAFTEEYENPLADVVVMLFGTGDAAAYAAAKPLQAEPGSTWHYSSGTTNIIARIMRAAVDGTETDYLAFPRHALFDRIAMHSAIIEPDAAGIFVGSSFMYATARDWARLGLLFLQDGIWQGERILPENWVTYSTTPTPEADREKYGAHFWLEIPAPFRHANGPRPSLPADMVIAAGYEGQFVTIIPSRELVIVRLGLTRRLEAWDQEEFVAQILAAISP